MNRTVASDVSPSIICLQTNKLARTDVRGYGSWLQCAPQSPGSGLLRGGFQWPLFSAQKIQVRQHFPGPRRHKGGVGAAGDKTESHVAV